MDMLNEGTNIEKYQEKIIERISEQKVGEIKVIVNNAGVNTRGLFKDVSVDDIREMALVNTYPYALLTKTLLPHLPVKSLVLTICSVIAFLPSAYDATYAATKAFELFQFESLRLE